MTALPQEGEESALPERSPIPGGPRWVLLAAFAGLLIIGVVSGAAATRILNEMHSQEQAARRAISERSETLSGLWLTIQVYDEAIQRYVSVPTAEVDSPTLERMVRMAGEIGSNVEQKPGRRESEEFASLRTIAALFDQQKRVLDSLLAMSPGERRRTVQRLIVEDLLPVRARIVEQSEKLTVWNGQQRQQTDQATLAQFGLLQAKLTRSLLFALGSGLLLVLASMIYIVRSERQRRRRYQELVHGRLQLQQLSARLVDAQEKERRSISRELHDEVGQSLGALRVDLGRLSASIGDDRPEAKQQLERMKSVTERTVETVRNIALLLRPSMLDDLGLAAALEWQGREVSRHSELEVDVQTENVSDELPDEYRVCLYRLVQEALQNAVRHSGAREARVVVKQGESSIQIEVRDNGRGFDPARTRGMGILGMEERVKRLGGTLRVESQPGKGTTVTADLPIPVGGGV